MADALIDAGTEFAHGFTYSSSGGGRRRLADGPRNADEGVVERVATDIGPYFQAKLHELADHPLVGDVAGRGLIGGMALVKDKHNKVFFDEPGGLA